MNTINIQCKYRYNKVCNNPAIPYKIFESKVCVLVKEHKDHRLVPGCKFFEFGAINRRLGGLGQVPPCPPRPPREPSPLNPPIPKALQEDSV